GGIGRSGSGVGERAAPWTIVEVWVSEAVGLVQRGRGAQAALDGDTRLGGRIPISTSGGLTSRGHPAYVTALYNYVELAEQLRGRAGERQVRNARLGLATGELGNYNAALIHVLEAGQCACRSCLSMPSAPIRRVFPNSRGRSGRPSARAAGPPAAAPLASARPSRPNRCVRTAGRPRWNGARWAPAAPSIPGPASTPRLPC